MPSCLSERVPNTGEDQYALTKATTQMIAENSVNVIIKAGDLSAFLIERVVDLSPVSNVSVSIVILYFLSPDLKAYVEEPLENITGLVLSSLLSRILRNLFT
jgi:hypothetical protein